MQRQVVYVVCAEGEEALAERLARPLQEVGYDVAHNGTITVGESLVGETEKALESGYPIVLCATARAIGSSWAHRIINAAHSSSPVRVFVVQMERQAYVGQLALDGKIARYCDDPGKAVSELIDALSKHFPTILRVPDQNNDLPVITRRHFLDQPTESVTFDIEVLDRFRAELREEFIAKYPSTLTAWEFLDQAGLWIEDHLTRLGALLFAKNPTIDCPTAIVKCTQYRGANRSASRDMGTLESNIPAQIIAARQFVADRVRGGEAPSTNQAQSAVEYDYPMIAVREIIANALVHRDYVATDSCVHVRLFVDRLEVSSPGSWLGRDLDPGVEYDLSSFESQSIKRNFRLAHIISGIRLVEGDGSGIPSALRSCEEMHAPAPVVIQDNGFVTVILRRREQQDFGGNFIKEQRIQPSQNDDGSPAESARRDDIVAYLRTLIEWMNTDPWPRDQRFNGPVLTPAAIECKLRVTTVGRAGNQELDADDLAERCQRLVILGSPGSGKTWLAKRIVRRCAEEALKAVGVGAALDQVEFPLYTTYSHLLDIGGDIRQTVVSSALDQLADLGGSRLRASLSAFFMERNASTVLVLDSLDEAYGSNERLRQVGTLPWRVILTSRPGSWNQQIILHEENDKHLVGEIQPLRYPADVELFIRRWFAKRPERANDLIAQIAQRPELQRAATVPLLLAFYCIIGEEMPLPELRRDLYSRVLKRMLTGRWRGSDDRQVDTDTCLRTLRAWAWLGTVSHPTTGVGTWADDIRTALPRLGQADQDALDHVATPMGPPDLDTGQVQRRFVHRSIREHLVAEYVARLPVDQAAEALLPHLWSDPDWEYAAPAALAMHPAHDQLTRDLIDRTANSDRTLGDLAAIDAGWQIRELLARVASESFETDWSPEIAALISSARVELARSGRTNGLGAAPSWETSNNQAREALLGLLADQTDGSTATELVRRVVQLDPTPQDRNQAREALLGLLAAETNSSAAASLADEVARLDPTPQDRNQAREALLGLLAAETNSSAAASLADEVARLDPTPQDRNQAREALLGLLAAETNSSAAASLADEVARLSPTPRGKSTGHVFISYVREDSHRVDQLQRMLQAAGIPVWRDTTDLWPGEDWRAKIRRAIIDNALVFIACFSGASLARGKSYQNEELTLAIEQMRLRRPDEPWLIAVRFDDSDIPEFDIEGGRALASLQTVDLFGNRYDQSAARLTAVVQRILGRKADPAKPASQ